MVAAGPTREIFSRRASIFAKAYFGKMKTRSLKRKASDDEVPERSAATLEQEENKIADESPIRKRMTELVDVRTLCNFLSYAVYWLSTRDVCEPCFRENTEKKKIVCWSKNYLTIKVTCKL